jgi:hypothetical protein
MIDMYERLHLDVDRCEGKFGIEIETEGENLPRSSPNPLFKKTWKIEVDGSLRGEDNAEYVLRKPCKEEDVREVLGLLKEAGEANESVFDESIRAGVHIHLNIQSYTPLELLTFITTYYILEDLLVHWCGKERVGNHFCLRASDAEFVINKLLESCQKKDWRHLNTEDIRYTALNLTSMFKYGSIEFRSMRSTKDLNDIETWIKLIAQLEKGARKFSNPKEVIHAISEMNGPSRFIEFVMEDMAKELTRFGNVSIMEGMRYVQPIAFMIDWDKFNKEKVNPFL